ncbi:hypothetical protein ACJ73_02905 [Blastomyces percursus]|uniref:Uncharacterized protein n=1 Tax=Blastomyces percursus TaxID=1658174 RepID=A0A1J9QZY8_9EURO|nr:hypothetical protein ACJ73_02905 [Blastomyces percursus]
MERRRNRNRERLGDSPASETPTVESGTQSSDIMQGLQAALNPIAVAIQSLAESRNLHSSSASFSQNGDENSKIGGGGGCGGSCCNLNFNIQIHHDDDKFIALRGKVRSSEQLLL